MGHTKETRARAYDKMKMYRKEWFLENGPCISCRSWEHLEVDHIKPKQKKHHAVWTWKPERRETELARCQVLCKTCHKQKHAWLKIAKLTHGTRAMYRKYNCRCITCKTNKSFLNKQRKEKGWRACYIINNFSRYRIANDCTRLVSGRRNPTWV